MSCGEQAIASFMYWHLLMVKREKETVVININQSMVVDDRSISAAGTFIPRRIVSRQMLCVSRPPSAAPTTGCKSKHRKSSALTGRNFPQKSCNMPLITTLLSTAAASINVCRSMVLSITLSVLPLLFFSWTEAAFDGFSFFVKPSPSHQFLSFHS